MNDATSVSAEMNPTPATAFMPNLFTLSAEGDALLLAGRCTRCGSYSFPRRTICQRCGPGSEVEPANLPGNGTVYASTVVRVPSPVGLKPPYANGYVDLAAAPLRVFALFGGDPTRIRPGLSVRMVVEPLVTGPKGEILTAYKFIPVTAQGDIP